MGNESYRGTLKKKFRDSDQAQYFASEVLYAGLQTSLSSAVKIGAIS